jgi:hypothetical protein
MKSVCITAAAAVAVTLSAASTPASSSLRMQIVPAQQSDISAARKTARRKAVVVDSRSPYYLRPGVKPSFGYIGPPGYAGEYAWRKSIGQCVEDLGYGRWSPCGQR